MRRFIALAVALALAPATAALADKKSDQSPDMGDPNRIICIKASKPGTRIVTSRSCHTAVEWALLRREQRPTVENLKERKSDVKGKRGEVRIENGSGRSI